MKTQPCVRRVLIFNGIRWFQTNRWEQTSGCDELICTDAQSSRPQGARATSLSVVEAASPLRFLQI